MVNLAESLVVKRGNVFLVSLRDGRLPVDEEHPLGLFLDDCRYLRGHELRLNGVRPRLLVASDALGSGCVHELTNPDLLLDDRTLLPLQTVQIRVERQVTGRRELEERILVHSYHRAVLDLDLEVELDADFTPMFVLRGIVESPRVGAVRRTATEAGLRFSAVGADDVERATVVTATPAPTIHDARTLRFRLTIPPGGGETVVLRYDLGESGPRRAAVEVLRASPPAAAEDVEAWLEERTAVHSDDELFDRVLRRSLLDIRLLHSSLGDQGYYAAGIPWYATLFGRDSLITAVELLAFDPGMAQSTLRLLAGRLGTRVDPVHDEEPGKVIHELRVGEVAHLGLTPLTNYYGTVDATPLFLCLLAEHADWSGDLTLFRELRDAVDAGLAWIDEHGDRDGDGLLEYSRGSPQGLENQGWKDSWDGIVDADGVPLQPPIAVVEAQGYAIRAKRRLARLFELEGDGERASQLRAGAAELARRLDRFWLAHHGYYAMALDAAKSPSAALGSNQGHLLWALAVTPDRAHSVRNALMGARMFSGWGVRTLAEGEPAYNPVGYHTGTVWPHDSAITAVGLRKYGYDADFTRIFEGLLEAASHSHDYRLPELFAGFSRTQYERPVPYPVACQPQAWAAGAIPFLLTAGLGLFADGLDGRLRIRRPSLPGWVGRVEVRNLRIAGSRVDLLFERAGQSVALTDAHIVGGLEVTLEIGGALAPGWTGGR
jgi:glycogen debranching enzyme